MDMIHNLNRNPEYRQHLTALIITQFTGLCLTGFFIFFLLGEINNLNNDRLLATVSVLERDYPLSFDSFIPHLSGNLSESDVRRGEKLLTPFGYDPDFSLYENPLYSDLLPLVISGFITLSILISGLNYFVYKWHQKKFYGKIAQMSGAIVSNLNGKTAYVENGYSEGIFDLMTSRFNQMMKKMQSVTEKLSRDKLFLRNLISDISHQLKTPMASLIMYNDLMLEDRAMDSETRADFLNSARHQLNRMEWLVKSLLKLARLETGTIVFDQKLTDLAEPLNRALKGVSHLKENRTIKIIDTRLEKIKLGIDINWLAEAFENILKNACQHTDVNSGIITLTLSEIALFLRIVVEDNGPGIPEKELPRIFERFFKGSSSINMESVGIGLPLSKMIIESHGGDLRVSSQEGVGTQFTISFPY